MERTISIIGGGVAGLAAGCYAQMNGYRTRVFEMHVLPGGLCTAWERGPYVFDGCLHYLFGSGAGQPFNDLWRELGAVQDRPFLHHEEMLRVIDGDGRKLIAYADPDRLEDQMKKLSPGDARLVETLCDGVRRFAGFDMALLQRKPRGHMTPLDWAAVGRRMMPYAATLVGWGRLSAGDFARRFRDPFLRRAVPHMFGWPGIPMLVGVSILAYMNNRNAGFPAGGSLEFARALERRYTELGGEVLYRSQVERVLVDDIPGGGRRTGGVRLYDNSVHRTDHVVSAADGRGTVFDMLGGEFVDRRVRRTFDGHLPVQPQVQVSLGVRRDLSAEPHWAVHLLDRPLVIAGEERHEITVKHYCFDPSLAPPGSSAVVITAATAYGYWQRIYGHRLYDTEQTEVSTTLVSWLNTVYPGIDADIEDVDEATPLSYERYTGNWQGSCCGWLLTGETLPLMIRGMRSTLPRLSGFRMAGQWVEPGGGVPQAAASGRNAIAAICREDGRPFVTSEP